MVEAHIMKLFSFFAPPFPFLPPLFLLGVAPMFYCSCFPSLSLLFLLSFCTPTALHLYVGLWCKETWKIDLKPKVKAHLKSNRAIFSAAFRERGRGCWNRKKRNEKGNRDWSSCMKKGPCFTQKCFEKKFHCIDNVFCASLVCGHTWSLLVCNYTKRSRCTFWAP